MATSNDKISLDDLNRKLGDVDTPEAELAQYFTLDTSKSSPFSPVLALNSDTVKLPTTAEGRTRSAALLNSANWISRSRRQRQFRWRIAQPGFAGPVIVSEGDSWFQYPFLLKDVIDHLMDDFAVFSLDAAGDTLENMLREAEYLDALGDTGASIFLISGGGNDLVAGGNLAAHLRQFDANLSGSDYLLPSFDRLMDAAVAWLDQIARGAKRRFPNIEVLCHGYDYVVPDKGDWLGKPMASRGIVDPALQRDIVKVMVDKFNARVKRFANGLPGVTYIDCRGSIKPAGWYDELHPKDAGYNTVAKLFANRIKQLAPTPRDVPRRGRSAPPAMSSAVAVGAPQPRSARSTPAAGAAQRSQAMSLHIGLNSVDPAHYAGWSGPLAACEFDAEDMQAIASSLGYKTTLLKTQQATRPAVIEAITAAATALDAGDIFLVSASLHGGQLPDFNRDEADQLDETWCLYDGQIVDDELYHLWSLFKPDVRIVVISDSCHSGSVIRIAIISDALTQNVPIDHQPRAMPFTVAARTARQNRAYYEKIGRAVLKDLDSATTREMATPIHASVRLISGCQDNQLSMDGLMNGAFTGALIETWNNGAFTGTYADFHKTISNLLPPSQTPNHFSVGAASPTFDAQRPFEI